MVEAQLYIDGEIVSQIPSGEDGFPLPGPFALLSGLQSQLEWQRELNGTIDSVRVQINSPGGETTQGFAMGDWLRSLDVPVTTVAIGQCSSIATAPFLAGSTRLVHASTEMLIHLPSGGFKGTGAQAAQSFADDMAACEGKLIDLYVERAGVDAAEVAALMAKETTLSADEALRLGFATAVVQPMLALAVLPTTASSPPTPQPATPEPTLMSKFNEFLTRMKTAISDLEKPADAKTALDVTTAGDNPVGLFIDAAGDNYAQGDMVYTDAEMSTAAADGDYVLSDGNTISVAAGAITAITEASTDNAADAAADGDVATALREMATAITALAGDVKSMKTANATQVAATAKLNTQYTALARGVKTNAAPTQVGKSGADDGDDTDPVNVAATARAERRKARYK